MPIQVEGVVMSRTVIKERLPSWVIAKSRIHVATKLRVELDLPPPRLPVKFLSPAWSGKINDWFNADGTQRVQVGEKITIRATGKNGLLT